VGKWHLGGEDANSLPTDHGFTTNAGGNEMGNPGRKGYYSPYNNLADARPSLADSLARKLDQWRDQVGAEMPTPNPDYRPVEGNRMLPPWRGSETN